MPLQPAEDGAASSNATYTDAQQPEPASGNATDSTQPPAVEWKEPQQEPGEDAHSFSNSSAPLSEDEAQQLKLLL